MRRIALVAAALLALGCRGTPAPVAATAPPAPRIEPLLVAFLGDSLTAGMGLSSAEAYPAVLERLLVERGLAVRCLNAGVSGDTSAGGLARLDWLLAQEPAVMVIALGANDGLRGLPPDETERNLAAILERTRAAGVRPVLAGMKTPDNLGPSHVEAFNAVFPRLAAATDTPLVGFLLEGVALVPEQNQFDGIHPTREGQERLAANVLPVLEPIVREAIAARAGLPAAP